jgi:hypothetical protein
MTAACAHIDSIELSELPQSMARCDEVAFVVRQ